MGYPKNIEGGDACGNELRHGGTPQHDGLECNDLLARLDEQASNDIDDRMKPTKTLQRLPSQEPGQTKHRRAIGTESIRDATKFCNDVRCQSQPLLHRIRH